MWNWVAESVQMLLDGLSLLLSGGLRLGLLAAACIFLYVLFRWFKDEPVKFVRQWAGFLIGVMLFFGGPYLLGKYLSTQIERHDWIPIVLYVAFAYIAYKAWSLIGAPSKKGKADESKDKTHGHP